MIQDSWYSKRIEFLLIPTDSVWWSAVLGRDSSVCAYSFTLAFTNIDFTGPNLFDLLLILLLTGLILSWSKVQCVIWSSEWPVEGVEDSWQEFNEQSDIERWRMKKKWCRFFLFIMKSIVFKAMVYFVMTSKQEQSTWRKEDFRYVIWGDKCNATAGELSTLCRLLLWSSCIAKEVSIFGCDCDLVLFECLRIKPHEARAVHVFQKGDLVAVGNVFPIGVMFTILTESLGMVALPFVATKVQTR